MAATTKGTRVYPRNPDPRFWLPDDGQVDVELASDVLWHELQRIDEEHYKPATRKMWDHRPPHKTTDDQKRWYEAKTQVEHAAGRCNALFWAIEVINDPYLDERPGADDNGFS